MTDIFDLPHKFVVFPPGAGGNFISGLLNNIFNNNLKDLDISPNGSSHTLVYNKQTVGDSISFGTHVNDNDLFQSSADKENYYLDRIKNEYADVTNPLVTWTHNYSNIALYKKYFKNSKVLVIHPDTIEEKLTCVFMHVTKVLLDKDAKVLITGTAWEKLIERLKRHCKLELSQLLPSQNIDYIIDDRFNPKYKNIMDYVVSRIMLKYFGMIGAVEGKHIEHNMFDYMLYPSKTPNVLYTVGERLIDCIKDADVVLPYNYLTKNNVKLLIEKLELLLDRQLSLDEIEYVTRSLSKYLQAQNTLILLEPVQFYNSLKEKFKLAEVSNADLRPI